jgi:hypothetical protein
MSESLATALALVQSRLPDVAKSKTATVQTKAGGTYKYDYADLAEVTRHILPLLGDAGLAWITKPTLTPEGKFVLAYKLLHISGQSEEGAYPLPQAGSPQEIGSAITYARRYTLCSVTGVAPEQDDDDGAAATKAPQETAARPPAARRSVQRAAATPTEPDLEDMRSAADAGTTAATRAQVAKVNILVHELGVEDRDQRLAAVSKLIGRDVSTSNDMTKREAMRLIDRLERLKAEDDPRGALVDLLAATGTPVQPRAITTSNPVTVEEILGAPGEPLPLEQP